MTKTITATEAVRKFSEILNSIKYRGDDYTIMRGGKPVATIRSVETHAKALTLGDLAGLVKSLPTLGDEAERFKKDLKEGRKHQPLVPEKDKWA
jgi:antitoxin (DNA-binding transcriptional repressor) of toxin-antitoxin stability system